MSGTYWKNWPKCEYTNDLIWAAEVTNKYLISYLGKKLPQTKPNAIILDIDDTLVFGDPEDVLDLQELSYNVTLKDNKHYTVEISPANLPIVNLANNAYKMGLKIILLTARPAAAKIDTIKNMEVLGINYHELIMNNVDSSGKLRDPSFKLMERRKLNEAYNIIATIGDQLTDLYLPGAHTLVIKLPDVKSKCSYAIVPL